MHKMHTHAHMHTTYHIAGKSAIVLLTPMRVDGRHVTDERFVRVLGMIL